VPEHEPPSDAFYKKFADDLVTHPDPKSSITFAPVPFGENENVQEDKLSAPTWCEERSHIVKRLRIPDKPRPEGVTEEELEKWLDPPPVPRASLAQDPALTAWAKAMMAAPPVGASPRANEEPADYVDRIRDKDKSLLPDLPASISKRQLEEWLAPPPVPRETLPKASTIDAWAKDLIGKRLTRYRYHWIGTDKGGRDVCARIIIGSRVSLSVGFVSVGLTVLIGIILCALAGYFRDWFFIVVSGFTEILICIPSFFLIL